jgi:type IV secretion system protein VirB10
VSDVRSDSDAAPLPPKEDPEALVLRGRPRPVVRFRRGLIIGITAAVSAGVVGVTWVALEPASFRFAADGRDEGEPLRKAPPDALANAPTGYGDVPRLGPPLPGDLGRPILDHERSLGAAPPAMAADGASAAERERAAAEALRQRRLAELDAARRSPVGVQLTSRPASDEAAPVAAGTAVTAEAGTVTPSAAVVVVGQQRKIDFARSGSGTVNPHGLEGPPSPWTLSAGTVIPASLITGLNSDLPGTVFAQVTENVADSATGQTILIPQGARLVGAYDSVIAFGQRRALLVWQRILLPDGSSVQLDNTPATDASGYSGVEDKVDSHTWRLLKGIALSTLLGVGTQVSLSSNESDLVRAVRESVQQNAGRAGDQITLRNLDVQPTIRVRPGFRLLAVIHKDVVLRPWRGGEHG